MTVEELTALDLPIEPNAETALYVEAAIDWVNDNTTLTIDKDDLTTSIAALPAGAKIFLSRYYDVMITGGDGVTSESIGGMSQSFGTDSKSVLLYRIASELIGKYLLGQVRSIPNVSKWKQGGITQHVIPPTLPAGADGASAYEIALENGFVGTEQEWLDSLQGEQGASAYEAAVESGYIGTEQEWLASLQGEQGIQGERGESGIPTVQNETAATLALVPNIMHVWGEIAELTITLAEPTDDTIANNYMFEFISGATPTVFNYPASIDWQETPTIEPQMKYQGSIVNNVGLLVGVAYA